MSVSCVFRLGEYEFNSERELDYYLISNQHKITNIGDVIFQKKRDRNDKRWEVFKGIRDWGNRMSADYDMKHGITDTSSLDPDVIEGADMLGVTDPNSISVTEALSKMTQFYDDKSPISPVFMGDNYWAQVKTDFMSGNFTGYEKILPYIFREGEAPRPLTSDEFDEVRNRITYIWKQQAYIGTAIHDLLSSYYIQAKGKKPVDWLAMDRKDARALMRKALEDYSDFYKAYLKENNNPFEDLFFDSVLNYIQAFDAGIRAKYGNDALIMMEQKISTGGTTVSLPIGERKLVGKMDMVVIYQSEGETKMAIIDFKASPQKYQDFDSTKTLTFNYQLAIYRRILQRMGIAHTMEKTLHCAPIQMKGFKWDFDKSRVDVEGITFEPSSMLIELDASRSLHNDGFYKRLEENISKIFSHQDDIVDMSTDEIVQTTEEWASEVFGRYGTSQSLDSVEVVEQISKDLKTDDSGRWLYQSNPRKSPRILPDSITTKESAIKYLLDERKGAKKYLQDRTIHIRNSLKNRSREDILAMSGMYQDENQASQRWVNDTLVRYTNERYRVLEDEAFDPILESYGIILVRNTLNNQIDVIKLSSERDLDWKLDFGQNKSILGNYISDGQAQADPLYKEMDATRGNVELMIAAKVINSMPSLFAANGARLGRIQVIAGNDGYAANNDTIEYNFRKLHELSKSKDKNNLQYGKSDVERSIKMASFVDLAREDLLNIQAEGNNRNADIVSFISIFDDALDDANLMRQRISDLIHKIDEVYPSLKNGYIIDVYDDEKYPIQRLYADLNIALGELSGINFQQQVRDGAKYWRGNVLSAAFYNGINGNQTDNPGNFESTALNQISALVANAFQNVRSRVNAFYTKTNKEYKAYAGGLLERPKWGNFYDTSVKGDVVFKNPFKDTTLTEKERNYLKFVLLEITKIRRPKDDITMDNLADFLDKSPFLLKAPITRKMSSDQARNLDSQTYGGIEIGSMFKNSLKALNGVFNKESRKELSDKVESDFNQAKYQELQNTNDAVSLNWDYVNNFNQGEDQYTRQSAIDGLGGLEGVETDLDVILMKFKYAEESTKEMKKVMPLVKSIAFHISNQGILQNKMFKNDLKFVADYVRMKIRSEQSRNDLGVLNKVFAQTMKVTSLMALGFNVKQYYQHIEGFFRNLVLIAKKMGNPKAYTFKNFKDAWLFVVKDAWAGENSLGEYMNREYGLNDMDMNVYSERLTHGQSFWQRAAFYFASRPDYFNRMTIFVANMKADGVFDAHRMEDGRMVYDFNKDKRFQRLINNDRSNQAEYDKELGLYIAMAKEMEANETEYPDGTKFKFEAPTKDGKIKPLPRAYTTKQSESVISVCDATYGFYSHEKKSMIQQHTFGRLFMQMATYLSSKKNSYFSGRIQNQDGEYVHYTEMKPDENGEMKPVKYYYKMDENGNFIPTTEETNLPMYVWKGRPHEGMAITLGHVIRDLNVATQEHGFHDGWRKVWDKYYNNEDPYLQQMYRANAKNFLADILGAMLKWMLFGWLMRAIYRKIAGEVDDDTLSGAITLTGAKWVTLMMDSSMSMFDPFMLDVLNNKLSGSPIFAFKKASDAATVIWQGATGQKDFVDVPARAFSASKPIEPLLNYMKEGTFGTKIGDNFYDE